MNPHIHALADHPSEDDRIRFIASEVVVRGRNMPLTVEDDPSTVARCQRKLLTRGCAILSIVKGPRVGEVTINVGPRTRHDIQ